MKSGKKLLTILFIFMLIFSMLLPATSAAADQSGIKILFTHDMHASLVPATVFEEGSMTESGGFARLYTAIQQERGQNPDSTLLVDAGDYSMGTLFQTLETTQSPELCLMGKMGYDAVTAGNHEFDYTSAGFTKSLEAAVQSGGTLPQYVMSNVTVSDTSDSAELRKAMQDYGIKDYTVIEKNGLKIGIYGLMGEEAKADAPMSTPAEFGDIVEASKRVVKILKEQEKVDFIVCLSHSGTNADVNASEDEKLAKAVPDIDVIISGHTHTVLKQPIIVGSTIIVSCGSDSDYLGVLDIKNDGGWKVNGYKLTKIDPSVADDASIASEVDTYKTSVNKYLQPYGMQYDDVVANSPYQFEDINYMFDNPGNYSLGDITADAFVYTVKQAEGENYEPVDAAVVPMGTLRATINKGDVSVADAFKILSLGTGPDGFSGYPLISVYLYGWELKNVCEVDASISSMMGDAQLFLSGIKYTYNSNRLIFNKVTDAKLVRENGRTEAIENNKLYRVVCSVYSGQMLSYVKGKSFGIVSLTPKDKDGKEITDFNKQIIYANNNGQEQEIKEWQAVAGYLKSFDSQNGISTIPAAYGEAQIRKVENNSTSIFDLLSNLNTFAIIAIAVVVVLLALIVFIIVKVIKRIRKHSKKQVVTQA